MPEDIYGQSGDDYILGGIGSDFLTRNYGKDLIDAVEGDDYRRRRRVQDICRTK